MHQLFHPCSRCEHVCRAKTKHSQRIRTLPARIAFAPTPPHPLLHPPPPGACSTASVAPTSSSLPCPVCPLSPSPSFSPPPPPLFPHLSSGCGGDFYLNLAVAKRTASLPADGRLRWESVSRTHYSALTSPPASVVVMPATGVYSDKREPVSPFAVVAHPRVFFSTEDACQPGTPKDQPSMWRREKKKVKCTGEATCR